MGTNENKSLMRNLGEFFGHIARGVKADPAKPIAPARPTGSKVRTEVQEKEQLGPDGQKIVLRRTTIEEIQIEPNPSKTGDAGV